MRVAPGTKARGGRGPDPAVTAAGWRRSIPVVRWPALAGPGLAVAAGALYLATGQDHGAAAPLSDDPFVPLARAFLAGRLDLIQSMPWLELVPRAGGGWYVPFPPLPALLLVPIVWAFPTFWLDTGPPCAVAGAVAVWLVWRVMGQVGLAFRPRLALAAGFAFGSEFVWVAATGGPHLWVQTLSATLLLGALTLALDGRWPVLAGFLFAGASLGCRLPVAFALPLFVGLYGRRGWPLRLPRGGEARALAAFAMGMLPVAIGVGWYNLARFGSPLEFGYGLIVGADGASVLSEPWFTHGIDSPLYLPRGLFALFLQPFAFATRFPWLQPTWMGEAVTFTMPVVFALWWARSRERLVVLAWLALVGVMLPDLMHGTPGFAQYGYRFVVDALPIVWILLAWVVRERGLTRGIAVALALGVAAQLYGLWTIWGLGFVS